MPDAESQTFARKRKEPPKLVARGDKSGGSSFFTGSPSNPNRVYLISIEVTMELLPFSSTA